jgi:hypothetical protein
MGSFHEGHHQARDMHTRRAEPEVIADLVRHAGELPDIIDAELAEQSIEIPAAAGAVLSQMRGRLRSLERIVGLPTLH